MTVADQQQIGTDLLLNQVRLWASLNRPGRVLARLHIEFEGEGGPEVETLDVRQPVAALAWIPMLVF